MDGTFKSVWAAADDHYLDAMRGQSKTTSPNNVNFSMYSGSWNLSVNKVDENQPHSNSGRSFHAKKTNPAGSKVQDLYTVSSTKNELNSQVLEDFEAIPEEFRPNKTARNLLPVTTKPASENVRTFNNTNQESNYASNYESCHQKNIKSTVKDFTNTSSKGMKWNDDLKLDSFEIQQQFCRKGQDSHLESKGLHQQKKRNYIHNRMPNCSLRNDYKGNSKTCGRKNQKQNPLSSNTEQSRVNETLKKHLGSSVTVTSKVTKLQVVTPGKQVQTKKTVQTWTTNSSDDATKNTNENKTEPNEVLFKNISRKSVGREMVWMDDLCTVKEISETDQVTFEYLPRSKSKFSPHDSKATPRPEKLYSFTDNLRSNRDNRESTNDCKSSKNVFVDHAEEFIKAQRRYKSEHENRKFERINLSNRQSNEDATVIQHVIKVIHVNQPNRRKGKWGCRGNKRANSPKPTSDDHQHSLNQTLDMTCQSVNSDENGANNPLKEKNETIYKFPPTKTINAKQILENKSKINTIQKRTLGLFEKSTDTEKNYSLFSTSQTTSLECPEDSEVIKYKRSLLMYYGAEISDTIVGSYTSMNLFLSFYKEWKNLRIKATQLLEDIIHNLTNTNDKRNKTKNVLDIFSNGGRLVAAIPDIRAALVGRIIATLSDFFAKLFSASPNLKDSGMNEFELMLCLQQDIDATSDMNIFGLQCAENFLETCHLIEDFHECIQGWCFKGITEGIETDFLEDISTLNPKHHLVYYRRLQKWIERLSENPTSDVSKAFSRGFKDFPEALGITNLLHWRYHGQGGDTVASLRSWNDIQELLQNGDSVAVVDAIKKIQNSILVLIKERIAMEKDVMELLQNEK